MTDKTYVLIAIEGGNVQFADAIQGDADITILDWDNVEGAEEAWRIADTIEEIEALPSTSLWDKAGILVNLNKKLGELTGKPENTDE